MFLSDLLSLSLTVVKVPDSSPTVYETSDDPVWQDFKRKWDIPASFDYGTLLKNTREIIVAAMNSGLIPLHRKPTRENCTTSCAKISATILGGFASGDLGLHLSICFMAPSTDSGIYLPTFE